MRNYACHKHELTMLAELSSLMQWIMFVFSWLLITKNYPLHSRTELSKHHQLYIVTRLKRNLPLILFFGSLFSFSISFLLQWPRKKWWESWGARWKRKLRHKNCILWINRHMGVYIRYGFEQLKVELVCQRTKKNVHNKMKNQV